MTSRGRPACKCKDVEQWREPDRAATTFTPSDLTSSEDAAAFPPLPSLQRRLHGKNEPATLAFQVVPVLWHFCL